MTIKLELKTGTLQIKSTQKKIKKLKKLIDFGSRINKKRGFLFVSKVLGKHIPVKPRIMNDNFEKMAKLLEPFDLKNTIFIGFAETATALGHGVFEAHERMTTLKKNNFYIHTTRYHTSSGEKAIEFLEEHSHAPSHILYEPKSSKLKRISQKAKNIVLIDDEVTSGKTTKNIIVELSKKFPKVKNYYVVSMLNWMDKKAKKTHLKDHKNINIEFLSLFSGKFNFIPKEVNLEKKVVSEAESKDLEKIIPFNYGRYGIQELKNNFVLETNTQKLIQTIKKNQQVLVLGTGEFMYIPYLFANFLNKNYSLNSFFHATTRSPINIDGIIYERLEFKDNYFENIDNFVYNISNTYSHIFICYETISLPTSFNLKELLSNKQIKVTELLFSKNDQNIGDIKIKSF